MREVIQKRLETQFGSLKECFNALSSEGTLSGRDLGRYLGKEGEEEGEEVEGEDLEEMLLALSYMYAEKGGVGLREFVRVFSG